MTQTESDAQCIETLKRTITPKAQAELRRGLSEENYLDSITDVYLNNPFFRLTKEEAARISGNRSDSPVGGVVRNLILTRELAARTKSPRFCVFCMPKSGSSFVQEAIRAASGLPLTMLTAWARPDVSSAFGGNAREQEIDELAIIRSILSLKDGFVAQHHTRATMYLAFQMKYFKIVPIVTIRNVLDCLVSMDDMVISWRKNGHPYPWQIDPLFIPEHYELLNVEEIMELLSRSHGIWLINFYLSWVRVIKTGVFSPRVIRYEEDILNKDRFLEILQKDLNLSGEPLERLRRFTFNPDRQRVRLNVGVAGRGKEAVPDRVVDFLLSYANRFRSELSDEEIGYLIGPS